MTFKITNSFDEFERLAKNKAKQFVTAAISVGAASSKSYAPVAYSALINSQKITITMNGEKVKGVAGYYVNYAKALETTEWKPKPPPKYGNKKKGRPAANAWNANAKPGFMKYGFENQSTINQINSLKSVFKV